MSLTRLIWTQVDIVVTVERGGVEEVVAIVELKSSAFELASAWVQHEHRWESHRICVEDGPSFDLSSSPELFLATVIPDHDYKIGGMPVLFPNPTESCQVAARTFRSN